MLSKVPGVFNTRPEKASTPGIENPRQHNTSVLQTRMQCASGGRASFVAGCFQHPVRLFLLAWSLFALLSVAPRSAYAHPMPSDITLASMRLHYHLIDTMLQGPASELVGIEGIQPDELKGEDLSKATRDKLMKWLPTKFLLEKDGKALTPEIVSADYQKAAREVDSTFLLTIHYATEKPANHLRVTSHFVHSIVTTGAVQFEMFGDKDTVHEFDTQANLDNVTTNVLDFMEMGMMHLFTGPDHILFICTLIFALTEFKSVVKMLTGFTVGHSITLILSTFNVIHISPRFADMAIAATIIYVGVENIIRQEQAKNRWLLVTMFGLIHGMGFSASLREVGLPEQGLVLCLLSFNIGLEIAQVIIVAIVYPILVRVKTYKEAMRSE